MRFHVLIYLALFSAFTYGSAVADIDNASLLEKLRQGGYVVLMRHAFTDFSQFDTHPVNVEDCETQRNLSSAGREQSVTIGKAIRTLAIPVGNVFSSQFCRCIDTAELAFGKHEARVRLSSFMQVPEEEKQRRVNYIKELLGTSPRPNTNTFLVTHRYMLKEASGVNLTEGGSAVFHPEGDSQFTLIAIIPASRWHTLLETKTESLDPYE
ncbi:histidine phosphatase family protein [Kaarinaea lacus]